jgi:hypothetical protein
MITSEYSSSNESLTLLAVLWNRNRNTLRFRNLIWIRIQHTVPEPNWIRIQHKMLQKSQKSKMTGQLSRK